MKLLNGQLVLETKNCTRCEQGTICGKQICPKCKGTGNGARGAKGQCKTCYGYRTIADHTNRITCPECHGNYINSEPETLCDSLPQPIWEAQTFQVYRSNREQTFNEAHLAFGCVYSCSDYGRHKSLTDEQLITKVRHETSVQATKISKDNGTVCNHIGIFTNDNGYSVRAVFDQGIVAAHEAYRSTHEG